MRNKLAHGQWHYPLNDQLDDVTTPLKAALNRETIFSLKQKMTLIEKLCSVVHDLVVSQPTFQRDWDGHFRVIEQTRINLRRKSYAKWEAQLRAKRRSRFDKSGTLEHDVT